MHLRANMEDTISFESSPMETGAGNTVEETSGCDRYKGSKGEWKEWREGIGYINDIASPSEVQGGEDNDSSGSCTSVVIPSHAHGSQHKM